MQNNHSALPAKQVASSDKSKLGMIDKQTTKTRMATEKPVTITRKQLKVRTLEAKSLL